MTAIIALAGLLVATIGAQSATSLFPELFFYTMVAILLGIIVVLFVYDFLWDRTSRYVKALLRTKRRNRLAREYFEDFRSFIECFANLPEFTGESRGIIQILESLLKDNGTYGVVIDTKIKNFRPVFQNPIAQFKQRFCDMQWQMKEMNYEFLNSLVKEFENYVSLHKQLYVDFVVTLSRRIGLENISQVSKREYVEYRDNYNQFIFAYTQFAMKCSKKSLYVFSDKLKKAEAM